LNRALEGKEILVAPNSPTEGVRVAMIVHDGAPVEILEFEKPVSEKTQCDAPTGRSQQGERIP
jgi:hypothetical protein